MKQALLVLCLMGLTGIALAETELSLIEDGAEKEECIKYGAGVGLGVNAEGALYGSFNIRYSPRGSIGVLGLTLDTLNVTKKSLGRQFPMSGAEAMISAGYWSNRTGQDKFGWHGYVAIGMSFAKSEDEEITVAERFASSRRACVGVDWKVNSFGSAKKNFGALALDLMVTQRILNVSLGVGEGKDKVGLGAEDIALLAKYQAWFF